MEALNFIGTFTIEQFKSLQKVDSIKVRKNPQTGKLFMTFGASVGAVATKGIPQNPVISEVCGADGATFYLLHEEGNGGAEVVATF